MSFLIPQVMLVTQNIINAYIPIKTLGRDMIIIPLYQSINKQSNSSRITQGTYVRVGSLCKENNKANYSHRVNFTTSMVAEG